MKRLTGRFYYGWVIVAISFTTMLLAVGLRNAFGVFFIAIIDEFGWGRAETAGAFSVAMIAHGTFALVTGTMVDRFGPRLLFPLGGVLLTIGLLFCSFIHTIWQLYVFFGVFVAISINTLSYAPHMSILPRWFIRKRGLASGIVLAGVGTGTMVILPVGEYLIASFGWRSAYLIFAALVLCILVPGNLLFQRRGPEAVGQFPDGIAPHQGKASSPAEKPPGRGRPEPSMKEGGWTLKAAISTRSFWFMSATIFTNGFVLNTLLVHQAIYVVDAGYSEMLAASLVGVVAVIGSISGIGCGLISDRIGREMGYTLGNAVAFLGILFLFLVKDTSTPLYLYSFVILYGVGYGSIPPITASTAADLFPGNALGRILAIQSMGFGAGAALGVYLGGYFYDRTHSYDIPFVMFLVLIVVGILCLWLSAPRRRRQALGIR